MKNHYISSALILLFCSACENPDSTASVDVELPDSSPSVEVAEEIPAVLSRLYTEQVSGGGTEHWYCQSSLTETPVAYLFPRDAVDTGTYVAIHPGQGFEASYSYSVLDEQTVALDYTAQSVRETLSGIEFEGADNWSGESSTDASLVCERRRVSVPVF